MKLQRVFGLIHLLSKNLELVLRKKKLQHFYSCPVEVGHEKGAGKLMFGASAVTLAPKWHFLLTRIR